MAGRHGWGEDSIYFDHSGECRHPEVHRHCPGRRRGVVSLKPGPDGQRRRKKVSGKNKTEVRAKLAELHDELNDGVVTNAAYTVAQAINDWLADGLAGWAPKTVSTQREVLEPLIDIIGAVPLRAHAGHQARRSQRHGAPQRRHARGHTHWPGRPPVHVAHIRAGRCPDRGGTLVRLVRLRVLSLLVGVRTEEARALRWLLCWPDPGS